MKRPFLLPLLLSLLAPAVSASDVIRVRLLDGQSPRDVRVEASAPLALYAGLDPLPLVEVRPGTSVRIYAETGRLRVEAPEMTFYTPQVRIGGPASADQAVPFHLHATAPAVSRQYDGTLRIDLDGTALRLIHAVDLETYVAAVVTREYGLPDDEGTRAMAILARTYALYTRGSIHPDYDVVDHVGSQVFHGLEGVSERARAAAAATQGQVLTWDGSLARAVYSSSNGGHSASNQEVWAGERIPYLQARPDPYDKVSPHSTWRTTLDRDQVLQALSAKFGSGVSGFVIDERSAEGRVNRVTLQRSRGRSQVVTGQQFRMTLSDRFGVRSLRSTLFDARREGNQYVFEGRGFGHGVGLSQWGAHGQAQEGRSAQEILAFYYPGTEISRLEGAPSTPSPALAAADPLPVEDERGANPVARVPPDLTSSEGEPDEPEHAEVLPEPIAPAPTPVARRAPVRPEVPEAVGEDTTRPESWTGPRTTKNPPTRRRGW